MEDCATSRHAVRFGDNGGRIRSAAQPGTPRRGWLTPRAGNAADTVVTDGAIILADRVGALAGAAIRVCPVSASEGCPAFPAVWSNNLTNRRVLVKPSSQRRRSRDAERDGTDTYTKVYLYLYVCVCVCGGSGYVCGGQMQNMCVHWPGAYSTMPDRPSQLDRVQRFIQRNCMQ